MPNTTIPAVLDQLRTDLKARAGLAGVEVSTGEVPPDLLKPEHIVLYRVDGAQNWNQMPQQRLEDYAVEGFIQIKQPGITETVIKAARDRAFAIFDEIDQHVLSNPTLAVAGVTVGRLTYGSLEQWANDTDRTALITLQLDLEARI